jgi:hypothetical protein
MAIYHVGSNCDRHDFGKQLVMEVHVNGFAKVDFTGSLRGSRDGRRPLALYARGSCDLTSALQISMGELRRIEGAAAPHGCG